jgi:hypothetical protein
MTKKKQAKSIKPTWPHTKNQRAQSRPVTHIKPVRFLAMRLLAGNPPDPKTNTRSLTSKQLRLLSALANAPRPVIEHYIAQEV